VCGVVLDGIAQVAHVLGCPCWSTDGRQLLLRRRRKVRLQATLDHGLTCNGGERDPVSGLASGNGFWFIAPAGWSGKDGLHKITITKIAQAVQWKPSRLRKIFGQQFASFLTP